MHMRCGLAIPLDRELRTGPAPLSAQQQTPLVALRLRQPRMRVHQ